MAPGGDVSLVAVWVERPLRSEVGVQSWKTTSIFDMVSTTVVYLGAEEGRHTCESWCRAV